MLMQQLNPILEALVSLWNSIVEAFNASIPALVVIGAMLGLFIATIVQLAMYLGTTLWPVIQIVWQAIQQLIVALIGVVQALMPLVPVILNIVAVIVAVLYPVFVYLVTLIINIVAALGTMLAGVITILSGVINFIVAVFTGQWGAAWEAVKQLFRGFVQLIEGAVSLIISPLTSIKDAVLNILGGINLFKIGTEMIQGLINGVGSMAGSLVDKVKGAVSDAVQGAKNLLGIKSPSRVFMEIGVNTAKGMIEGMASQDAAVEKQGGETGKKAQTGADGQTSGGNSTSTTNNSSNTTVNINISGGGDPRTIAQQVLAIINAQNRNSNIGLLPV
jgi:phage-related protein